MKLLFIVKTYHNADEYFEKKLDLFEKKTYEKINDIFCNFYCNWLSEFYLELKKKYNCEIIFPNNFELIKSISCEETKRQYFEYLDFIYNDYNPDILISNTESKNIISSFIVRGSYNILWKSSKISKDYPVFKENYFHHILSDNQDILQMAAKYKLKNSPMLVSIPDRVLNFNEYKLRNNKVLFMGSIGNDYDQRRKILKDLIKNKIDLEIRSRNIKDHNNKYEKIIKLFFEYFSKNIKISNFSKNPLYGLEMFQYMSNFKNIINIHSDFDKNNALNLRIFESLSQGCLLFTDPNKKMEQYFKNEENLVIYSDQSDLIKKISFYKKNQDIAQKISKNGFDQIKKSHTTSVRLEEFKNICNIT